MPIKIKEPGMENTLKNLPNEQTASPQVKLLRSNIKSRRLKNNNKKPNQTNKKTLGATKEKLVEEALTIDINAQEWMQDQRQAKIKGGSKAHIKEFANNPVPPLPPSQVFLNITINCLIPGSLKKKQRNMI